MISLERPLVLGSASPRRRGLLEELGVPLMVRAAEVPELGRPGEGPAAYLERVTLDKLEAVAEKLGGTALGGVLVADTIVVVDDEVLGKPADRADAERLVLRLVGRTHRVYTRYAIAAPEAPARPTAARTVETAVTMRAASAEEVKAYAATGEGLDKAGAYAVQGIGSFLIERLEGSYTNVVGLPVCEVVLDLQRVGLLTHFP